MLFVGDDWAEDHHDVELVADGRHQAHQVVESVVHQIRGTGRAPAPQVVSPG